MIELMREGGFVMGPLLFLSVVTLALSFEKFWALWRFSLESSQSIEKAQLLLKEGKIHEAKGLSHQLHPLVKAPFVALFDSARRDLIQDRLERRLKDSGQGLRAHLWILGTIGASAPFLGLFGTVVGIIKSFENIAVTKQMGFPIVAAGLGEALVATASGIFVAVMAILFYNYFQNRILLISLNFKHRMEDLKDLIP